MTEVVLLFPIFMVILFFTAKIFALLVLIQKMEIASYYAARKWQLESHLNVEYSADDDSLLTSVILPNVKEYLGFNNSAVRGFLNLRQAKIEIVRTQVWNVVTLTVETDPVAPAVHRLMCKYPKPQVCSGAFNTTTCFNGYDYICAGGRKIEVIKYVPNRDRPIKFVLPGLK
ncbi:MAG: hypothetical protein HY746_07025 [Elusimicrobia bacterium]|nr:hypothetical protein [Elusimicrobiota bacterium]